MRTRLVIGCMSGTSMDGLDAALVEITGHGLAMRARLLRGRSVAYASELSCDLRRMTDDAGPCLNARSVCDRLGELNAIHESVIRAALQSARPDLIVVHGQTIHHAPPQSWQLAAPTALARAFGAAVVYDLRAADLAAGGQGAPITPLADYVLFRDARERRIILNVGGFANYTFLPTAPLGADAGATTAAIRGGDICLCNQLLDAIARQRLDRPFDQNGAAAQAGRIGASRFDQLRERLRGQARAGRSLGTEDQQLEWVRQFATELSPEDAARTACEAIAAVIGECMPTADRVLLAGGGARNQVLVGAIRRAAAERGAVATAPTDELGVPIEYREAVCMAVLGALCADRVPITLPQITGVAAPAPIAGTWILPDGVDPAAVFTPPQ